MRQVVQAANGDDRSINLDFHPKKNLQDNLYDIRDEEMLFCLMIF